MTVEDITAILRGVIAAEKAAGQSAMSYLEPKQAKKIPEYYEGYRLAIEQRNRIRPHKDVDYYPEDMFAKTNPNATREELDYLRNSYRCTTVTVWKDFVSTAGRALIDHNWSIKYPEDLPKFKDYVQSGIETYGSIESYIKTILVDLKLYDPNGIIAIRPRDFETVEVTGEDGNTYLTVNDQAEFKAVPMYYGCDKIVAKEAGRWYMVLTAEKSVVEYNGRKQNVGRIFEVYDSEYVWKVEQVGKAKDQQYTIYPWYEHGCKRVPATELKGVPTIKEDGSIFWVSPFYSAVGLLDLALMNRNIIQVPIRRMMFPMPVMEGDECDFSDENYSCHQGILEGEGRLHGTSCKVCHGTGTKSRISPFGGYLYKRPSKVENEAPSASNPVQYVSPPTDSSKFVLEVVDRDEKIARDILHLKPPTTSANGTTATEVNKDNKAMYAFILPISNQIFDIYQFILDVTEAMFTNNPDAPKVELTYPQSFDFKTEGDYLEELKFAREAGAPDIVIHALVYRLISNMFFTEGETAKAFEIIVMADRLIAMSPDAVNLRKAQNQITNAELLIHDSGLTLINQLMMGSGDWINLPIDKQLLDLTTLAKSLAPERTNNIAQLALDTP